MQLRLRWRMVISLTAASTMDLETCWPLQSSFAQLKDQMPPMLPCQCCSNMLDARCLPLHDGRSCFDEVFNEERCCQAFDDETWSLFAQVEHASRASFRIRFQAGDSPWWMQYWTYDFPQYGVVELAAWKLLHDDENAAVDIGANVGQISLLFSASIQDKGSAGALLAVEADPSALALLHRNLQDNQPHIVKPLGGAVVGEAREPTGSVTLCSDGGRAVAFSPELVWPQAGKGKTAAEAPTGPTGPWDQSCEAPVQVLTRTVADVMQIAESEATRRSVDFVKLDVEGAEASILPALVPELVARKASIFVSIHVLLLGQDAVAGLLALLVRNFPLVLVDSDGQPTILSPGSIDHFDIPSGEYFDVIATFKFDEARSLAARLYSSVDEIMLGSDATQGGIGISS